MFQFRPVVECLFCRGTVTGALRGFWAIPSQVITFGPTPGSGAGLAVADFNGDGKPDIVATFLGDAVNAPNVTVLLNETVPYGTKTHAKRRLGAGRR